jgi:alpha-N-arabinofuranosidase
MTNIAQTVNVLQAMILTSQEKMVLTPTYLVFEMYKVHQGATLLPTDAAPADYEAEAGKKIPSVSVSASKASDGKIHISLVNARPDRPAKVTAKLPGVAGKSVTGRIVTAEKLDAHNTFDDPETVKPAAFDGAKLADGQLTLTLPPKSVVVLEVQ